MTTDDRRAALLAARTVNGIDFVEVDPADETSLVVHFVLNLPTATANPVPPTPTDALVAGNFAVTGGERITGIGVLSATATADDQMTLVVSEAGDFSTYRLVLHDLADPAKAPPGFDPASAWADFLFHIDCANDADCALPVRASPALPTPPPTNYLAKDYPGFVQLMLDRMSLLAPRWQERNPADLGLALVEMLAYTGDQLSYRQDVVATEAYLGTARLRTSVRRHARLVDYRVGEGANARAWLRVLLGSSASDGLVLPAGTRCATGTPGADLSLLAHETRAYEQAIAAGSVFFETVRASSPLSPSIAEMPLYAWSDTRAVIPKGATHATLSGGYPQLTAGMLVVLAEAKGPRTGDPADADPAHRQVVRVTAAVVTTDPLNSTPITEIDWHPSDALTFDLHVSSVTDAAHGQLPILWVSVAWGNIVLADQGRSVGSASDPLLTGPQLVGVVPFGRSRFRPTLAESPLTFAADPPGDVAPATAAVTTKAADPVVSLTSVDLDGNSLTWTVTSDLLDAGIGPTTPAFVPEVETDGTAYLLFGDGINGLRPEPGAVFTATYRVGSGTSGNVARSAITLLDPYGVPAGVVGVTNPLPAWGGVDAETIEHVRQSAPVAFRSTQARAVTAADYQALAATYPGVQRAGARLRWTGSWHTVFVTVERTGEAALDPEFERGLIAFLDGYRMAGVDLAVQNGIAVPLFVRMSVCVQSGYVAADVEQALLRIFNAGIEPDGTPGLFSPTRLDLGQPFYLSPLIAAAQAVSGVGSVQVTRFERQDRTSGDGLTTGVLYPQPLEFFALDNDPSRPERGRFELTVEGGL